MEITEHPKYKDYYISECGEVFKKLAGYVNPDGYRAISVAYNKKQLSRRVHRLVADTYIPNPKNKEQVNHIDGNRINNHVSNLEWATHFENMNAYRKPIQINNKSGHRGITKDKANGGKQFYWSYGKVFNGKRYKKSFTNITDALCFKYIVLLKIKSGIV